VPHVLDREGEIQTGHRQQHWSEEPVQIRILFHVNGFEAKDRPAGVILVPENGQLDTIQSRDTFVLFQDSSTKRCRGVQYSYFFNFVNLRTRSS
jgi:hypothetical protein